MIYLTIYFAINTFLLGFFVGRKYDNYNTFQWALIIIVGVFLAIPIIFIEGVIEFMDKI